MHLPIKRGAMGLGKEIDPKMLSSLKKMHEIINGNHERGKKGQISYLGLTTLEMVHWIGSNHLLKFEGKMN